jgi:general secretion pathway protein J
VLLPLDQWRLYYYRDNAWSNPQSSGSGNTTGTPNPPSGGTNSSAQLPTIPDGIRVELTLPPDSAISGRVTMDWVNPLRSNNRS